MGLLFPQSIVRRKYQGQLIAANNELEIKNRELKYLTSKLEQLVFIDPLTQIANRRALKRYLDDIYKDEISRHLSLSILMLDIDNFKSINDKLGHLEGDQCLQSVARHLQQTVTESNFIFARYGGEEFTLAFVGISKEKLTQIAEEILRDIRTLKISHPHSQLENTLTVSIGGVIVSSIEGSNYIELIQTADRALYRAKSQGKDQAIIESYSKEQCA